MSPIMREPLNSWKGFGKPQDGLSFRTLNLQIGSEGWHGYLRELEKNVEAYIEHNALRSASEWVVSIPAYIGQHRSEFGMLAGLINTDKKLAIVVDIVYFVNEDYDPFLNDPYKAYQIGYLEHDRENIGFDFEIMDKRKKQFFTDYHRFCPKYTPYLYGCREDNGLDFYVHLTGPVLVPFMLNGELIDHTIFYPSKVIFYDENGSCFAQE